MLKRSSICEAKAKWAIEQYNIFGESAYIDSMCFDTQQAIEFLLKGILLNYNVDFPKVHDLTELISLVKENIPIEFSKMSDLETLATTVTYWEEGSRYDSGVRTTVNTVRRCLNIYKSVLNEFLDIREQEQNMDLPNTSGGDEPNVFDDEDLEI